MGTAYSRRAAVKSGDLRQDRDLDHSLYGMEMKRKLDVIQGLLRTTSILQALALVYISTL